MAKKKLNLGVVSAVAAGAGATAYLMKKSKETKETEMKRTVAANKNYRNTERGKNAKNSRGIYYSNGNYEAFARPEKPEGVENKNAYIVGSGLASLAAACFLVRDGQMPGSQIHILEAMDIAGGACDGIYDATRGCAAEEKWKTILNVSGIYSTAFLLLKNRAHLFSMNFTG